MVQVLSSYPKVRSKALNLLALSEKDIFSLVSQLGWPTYRGKQILHWLYGRRIHTIDHMTDLSLSDRNQLKHRATIQRFSSVRSITAHDGTRKYLMSLDNGLQVESVFIPEGRRITLCLSTQVGCTLDCSFCLTGTMGLQHNLAAHEIVDQVLTVQDHLTDGERLSSLVLMGMGEPLANINAVMEAITRLTHPRWGVGFSSRHITLSTAGLAPRMKEIAQLGVNLAISLNAATDEQRNQLMPAVNHLYPLPVLLKACHHFPLRVRQRLTFEYVLLAGVNDSPHDAKQVGRLLRGLRCKINLIPFNEFPGSPYRRPSEETIFLFQSLLRKAGFDVFVRKSRGRDVLGACGQLGNRSSGPQNISKSM